MGSSPHPSMRTKTLHPRWLASALLVGACTDGELLLPDAAAKDGAPVPPDAQPFEDARGTTSDGAPGDSASPDDATTMAPDDVALIPEDVTPLDASVFPDDLGPTVDAVSGVEDAAPEPTTASGVQPRALMAPPDGRGVDGWGGITGSGLALRRTGFFHLEHPAGAQRTWLVDPDGNPLWALGVNSVLRTANCDGIEAWVQRGSPWSVAATEWARLSRNSAGTGYGFNNVGGFSDGNDVGAYPSPVLAYAPYGIVLDVTPSSADDFALRRADGTALGRTGTAAVGSPDDGGSPVGDPYNPAFAAMVVTNFSTRVRPTDARLMYYWLGNELGFFDRPNGLPTGAGGVRDLRRWLWSRCPATSTLDTPQCAPHALGASLRARYGTVSALNAAWGTSHTSFDAVLAAKPVPGATAGAQRCNSACGVDLQRAVRALLTAWIRVTTTALRRLDPNHLVSSPRLAIASPGAYCFWGMSGCDEHYTNGDAVPAGSGDTATAPWALFARRGDEGFDLVSINAYSHTNQAGYVRPWFTDGVHRIQAETGLPVLVSEFGIRARIEGWSNAGGALSFVPSASPLEEQQARGAFYATDIAQFVAFRGIIGASFHRWADRYDAALQPGTSTHDAMNMGIVHRDGSRWQPFDAAIRQVNTSIYNRIRAATGF